MDILMNYAFQIIALGTALLAAVAAPVGALSVYKGQSLRRRTRTRASDSMRTSPYSSRVSSASAWS